MTMKLATNYLNLQGLSQPNVVDYLSTQPDMFSAWDQRAAKYIPKMQSRTSDNGQTFSLGVGQRAKNTLS